MGDQAPDGFEARTQAEASLCNIDHSMYSPLDEALSSLRRILFGNGMETSSDGHQPF